MHYKLNLARNFKYMTTVFKSNQFHKIIENKQCWVTFFVQNKESLNNFMRESAKKAKQNIKKATQHVISSI